MLCECSQDFLVSRKAFLLPLSSPLLHALHSRIKCDSVSPNVSMNFLYNAICNKGYVVWRCGGVCGGVCVYVCLHVCRLFVCLFVGVFVGVFVCLLGCLFVFLCVCLFFVCLFVRSFVCLSRFFTKQPNIWKVETKSILRL